MSLLTEMQNEMWLAKRLRDHGGPAVYDGLTTAEQRLTAVREAIESLGLRSVIVGAKDGKPVTWAQAFERCYRVKL